MNTSTVSADHGELEILSRITNDIRTPSDLEEQVREVMTKVAEVIPFRRGIVVHAREGGTRSRGFIYRGTLGDDPDDEIDDTSCCGPSVDVDEYLRCFGLHARHDKGFRWYHTGLLADGLDAPGMNSRNSCAAARASRPKCTPAAPTTS